MTDPHKLLFYLLEILQSIQYKHTHLYKCVHYSNTSLLSLLALTARCSGLSVNMVQSVAFSSPACYPQTEPLGWAGGAGKAQAAGACSEVLAQQRIDETSTSLEAALKVVEKKLAQDDW